MENGKWKKTEDDEMAPQTCGVLGIAAGAVIEPGGICQDLRFYPVLPRLRWIRLTQREP